MPGIDGIECCRRLKSELQTCHIPVILLTACSLDERVFKAMTAVQIRTYPSLSVHSYCWRCIHNLIDLHQRLKQFFGDRQTLAKEDICDLDKDFC